MWKEYSMSHIRNNKASSTMIVVAALIASLFLSMTCSLFYNMWIDQIDQVIEQDGDWQGRLTRELTDADRQTIQNFANVTRIAVMQEDNGSSVVDIYFEEMRDVYQDMPRIAAELGLSEQAIAYHDTLLSQYLIFDPMDENPPLLLILYLCILVLVSGSLVLIIHNAFAESMTSRIHQLGILSSIGATPRQIRLCLLQEAAALSFLPVIAGSIVGVALCAGIVAFSGQIAKGARSHIAVFQYHPVVGGITLLASGLTIWLSAWIPARKMSKCTPLETIYAREEPNPGRHMHSRILSVCFGIEGELAGNGMRARRKALRTTNLSLTLSFLAFAIFLCFTTLSGISTKHTYFERYKDSWDIMVQVKNTPVTQIPELEEIAGLGEVGSCVAYQREELYTLVTKEQLSSELWALQEYFADFYSPIQEVDGGYLVRMPVIILDDKGFEEYEKQMSQMTPLREKSGGILLNRIGDSIHGNFRSMAELPFVEEAMGRIPVLDHEGKELMESIPVQKYTKEPPILREEYDNGALVLIVPASLWAERMEEMSNKRAADLPAILNNASVDTNLRILAADRENQNRLELDQLETKILTKLPKTYEAEAENRIQKEAYNEEIQQGYQLFASLLCGILACIGIANLFTNTLGLLQLRRREFARYLSIGMTPAGMRKVLWVEALTIAARPLLVTLPAVILFVKFAVPASHLEMAEFLEELPVIPMAVFMLLILLFVGLAYGIGEKQMMRATLAESLRDDTRL